jgi:hypothetical protein
MSLGGNFSSGYTQSLIHKDVQCSAPPRVIESCGKCSKIDLSGSTLTPPVAVYPSMLLLSRPCPPPTPEDFALYPKVAIPSSVRTQNLVNKASCNPSQRFAQFNRWQVPVPCPPLPPSMAGISQPSSRLCNP